MNARILYLAPAGLLLATGLLSGCGTATTAASTVVTTTPYVPPIGNYQGGLFTGQVLSGSMPVVGATVQLYAAGTAGNGSASTQLLSTGLITDSNGSFNENVAYTCPYNTSVLYVVARGGKAGSGGTNAGTTLMTSPGACSNIASTPKFVLNEVTTVAAAYTFTQFLAAGGKIGASSTNSSGITLAAGTFANLVNINTGSTPGSAFPSTATAPTGRINALANALNACIASSGAASSACSTLYSAATVSGNAPTNTLDAILNIATHPGTNVSALYTLSASSTAFSPALTAAPSDWTMFVTYTGGGMNDPASVAIDSQGRVWVSNYFAVASLFSNTGAPVFAAGVTGNNLYESYGAAIDANDNVWLANEQTGYSINGGLGNITVLNSAGAPTAGTTGFSSGGLNFPLSISFDSTDVAWVVDYGDSHLTLLNSSGTPTSGSTGYVSTLFQFPVAVAVDSKRNGYVANQSSNQLVKVPADGSSFTPYACCTGGSAVAIDESDNAWVANYYGDSVGLVSAAGTIVSGGGFTGGGILHPQGLAIDGAGKAWVANYRGPSISELAAASSTVPGQLLSPAAGWGPDANLLEAFGLAIDAGGNIWVSNFGNNSLTEFLGMATPVKTPLSGPVRVP